MKVYFFLTALFPFLEALSSDLALFEGRRYDPVVNGLKKLQFKVAAPHLKQQLNSALSYGNIHQIIFDISWTPSKITFASSEQNSDKQITPNEAPKKFKISIQGLPEGFPRLRDRLKAFLVPYLDFVIPEKITQQVGSYDFTKKTNDTGHLLQGMDRTKQRDAGTIEIQLDTNKLIKYIKAISPQGVRQSNMSYSQYPWINNKYVVTSTTTEIYTGLQQATIKTNISYENYSGYAFPSTVTVENTNTQTQENTSPSTFIITFSEYKVN